MPSKVFAKIDLQGTYNLLCVAKGKEWKTACRACYGLFEYKSCPFGLTHAPAPFDPTPYGPQLQKHAEQGGHLLPQQPPHTYSVQICTLTKGMSNITMAKKRNLD
jgi:hypothetical protein